MEPDDAVDLTEQMRELGVSEFKLGDLHVVFRSDLVVAKEVQQRGKNEDKPAGRDLRATATAQGIGPPRFPGSDL